jgi:hypothetical protein
LTHTLPAPPPAFCWICDAGVGGVGVLADVGGFFVVVAAGAAAGVAAGAAAAVAAGAAAAVVSAVFDFDFLLVVESVVVVVLLLVLLAVLSSHTFTPWWPLQAPLCEVPVK